MESLQFSVTEIDGDMRVIRLATLDDGAMAMEQVMKLKNEGVIDESTAGAAVAIIATKVMHEANIEIARGRAALEESYSRQAEQRRHWRGIVTFGWLVMLWASVIFVSLALATRGC